ncbi:MAG: RNA polymerase sigma factor [Bryobacteraceae bacterium]
MIFRDVEDPDLIEGAKRGKVEAYNVLVSRWEKRVFNYLLRLVGDREDAMDLSQEVFLKAYLNLKRLEDRSRFAPWLFRIAHNEAYSHLRRKRPQTEWDPQTAEASPSSRAAPLETALAVRKALELLPDEQKEAVVLKVYEGFKFEEIAEILSCPVSTVKSRLYTALDNLKQTLAPIDARGVE